jgi:glutaminase
MFEEHTPCPCAWAAALLVLPLLLPSAAAASAASAAAAAAAGFASVMINESALETDKTDKKAPYEPLLSVRYCCRQLAKLGWRTRSLNG